MLAASVDEKVPRWLEEEGKGWLTAEYAMHPRSNPDRKSRDGRKGRVDGRSTEIQRLIGRSLRACLDLKELGPRSMFVDCDVLDADGGTRTASVTAGSIAVALAVHKLHQKGLVKPTALKTLVAAVSVGMVDGRPVLDLDYPEDSTADVDLNVVATATGELVEVQGTAEGTPTPKDQLHAMLDLALEGIASLVEMQRKVLREAGVDVL